MVTGISGVSNRIGQTNIENTRNKEAGKEIIKQIQEERPGDKITRPDGTGQFMDIGA